MLGRDGTGRRDQRQMKGKGPRSYSGNTSPGTQQNQNNTVNPGRGKFSISRGINFGGRGIRNRRGKGSRPRKEYGRGYGRR